MKNPRLDIFEILHNIDNNNLKYYDNLKESQKKQFSPILVHQWLIGKDSKTQLELLDGLVNTVTHPLHRHNALLYKLMVCSSDGKQSRYKYLKKKKNNAKPSMCVKLIMLYLDCSTTDAKHYLKNYKVEDMVEIAEEMGYDEKDINKIIKLYA